MFPETRLQDGFVNLGDFGAGDNQALREIIAQRIRERGPISFAEFFELAMYHPRYGYYVCCDPTLDYQSSPNVHPIFGAMIARQLAGFWRLMDRPQRFDVFEAGASSGRLAADVLRALRIEAPELYDTVRYVLQDVTYGRPQATSDQQQGQNEPLAASIERVGLPSDKVSVAVQLPEAQSVTGCILSNELLDALPFERVIVRDGRLRRLMVGLEGERFVDVEAPSTPELDAYFARLGLLPGEGCQAEAGLEVLTWVCDAARALQRGYVLSLDYGYEAEALYAPWRKRGTLLSFYRHTSGDDPYVRIGRQDLTASVDFTSVIRAGESNGLRTLGPTAQSEFLATLGIGEALTTRPAPAEIEAFYALRRGIMELIDPSGLGRIRALIQGRAVPDELPRRPGHRVAIDRPARLKP